MNTPAMTAMYSAGIINIAVEHFPTRGSYPGIHDFVRHGTADLDSENLRHFRLLTNFPNIISFCEVAGQQNRHDEFICISEAPKPLSATANRFVFGLKVRLRLKPP
jgi:hypothetical protein